MSLEDNARIARSTFWTRHGVLPLTVPATASGYICTFLNRSSQLAIPLLMSGPDGQGHNRDHDAQRNELWHFAVLVQVLTMPSIMSTGRLMTTPPNRPNWHDLLSNSRLR